MKWAYIALGCLIVYLIVRISPISWVVSSRTDLPRVGDLKYDLMLRALLDRNIPEIDVRHLAKHGSMYQRLDARSYDEYEVSHLSQAHWVGYDDFQEELVESLDKNQATVVYCSVGYRSEKVVQKLIALGFTNVYNLYGGLFEWVNRGHEVIDMSDHVTSQIHAYNKVWGVWVSRGQKVYQTSP